MAKKAVILFNLGGPDSLDKVEDFLFNLFYDPAIISLPNPFRYLLAKLISKSRKETAQEIYSHIGGRSPILELTKLQAKNLEESLKTKTTKDEFRVFVAMRHAAPFAKDVWQELEQFAPEEMILLPLYPQFSTTTSLSSLREFKELAGAKNYKGNIKSICCYPTEQNFINSHVHLIKEFIKKDDITNFRILFSAHGLPEKIINKGDPYSWQIEQTVAAVMKSFPKQDHVICYQSRVGPLKWIGPDTPSEIKRAGKDKKSILLVPISFVSDHSETLVELDIEYKKIAEEAEVKEYVRVTALNSEKYFIESLAQLTLTMANNSGLSGVENCSFSFKRICPDDFKACPNQNN